MKVGLIDVDGDRYPNLALMKISSHYKKKGDEVEWYDHLFGGYYDIVYMSKIFNYTPDYPYEPNADVTIRGGSGYNLFLKLPLEIENTYPDYDLYREIYPKYRDTAIGFLTRGCYRDCAFCIVTQKEGNQSCETKGLSTFFQGQKNIEILDPNLLANKNHIDLLTQLVKTGSYVNFNQGLDIRHITNENLNVIKQIRIKYIHFAWDKYSDGNIIVPKLRFVKEKLGYGKDKIIVYVLTNYGSTFEEDIERVMKIREIGFSPYIMRYDKHKLARGCNLNKLARWVNNRSLFYKYKTFEQYLLEECR